MERVKNMDKYTVLSELKKFISKPIKVTDVNINRDIFEVPEEKINKTSVLYSVKDGKKNIYIPVEQKEEQIKETVDDATIKKLLKSSGKGKKIATAYAQQEETKEGLLSVLNKLLSERREGKPKVDIGEELIKKEKARTEQPTKSTAIVPVEKKVVERRKVEAEEEKQEESDSENEDIVELRKQHKVITDKIKRKLLIPVVEEQIREIKLENPDIKEKDVKGIERAILKEAEKEDVEIKDINKIVKKTASEILEIRKANLAKAHKKLAEKRALEAPAREERLRREAEEKHEEVVRDQAPAPEVTLEAGDTSRG